jgi:hypothetical protein
LGIGGASTVPKKHQLAAAPDRLRARMYKARKVMS